MSKIFNLNKINRSNCHIDINKAKWFNKKYFNNISDYEILNLIKYELNKHNLNYKYFYKLNNIINNIKKRIYFKYDIWPNIYYLFKTPKKYKKINFLFRIKNYKYILINLIKFFYNLDIILYNNILKNINKFSLKTNLLIKDIFIILRISLVGDLKGIDLLNIIYIIGKKECLIRIYNLYKFINRI